MAGKITQARSNHTLDPIVSPSLILKLRYSAMSAISWQRSALSKGIRFRDFKTDRSRIHLRFQVLWDRVVDCLVPGTAADRRLRRCVEETHLLPVSDLQEADQFVAIHFVVDLA